MNIQAIKDIQVIHTKAEHNLLIVYVLMLSLVQ